MTGVLRVVLGDQLSDSLSSLTDLDAARDVVLMAEVRDECTYVKHHKQKIVLVLSAMRHFAARLRARGVRVDYVALDDAANTHSLRGEMLRAVRRFRPARVVVTEAAEWRLTEDMRHWHEAAGLEVEIRDDLRFLARRQDFFAWARGKSQLRMEFFYRDMRRRTGLLMDGDQPVGGKWNYDPENRKALPKSARVPAAPRFPPDAVTRAVMALVAREFGGHFGDLDGFAWPVTAEDAAAALDAFVRDRLPFFGDWQDAMKTGEFALFHALISTSLNVGLLDPRAVCDAAAASFAAGHVPLNAAEGFIRQVLGWREFIRGVYWLHMPGYGGCNALAATRKLPWFYWSGETRMNCVHQVVRDTAAHAYAHHIQRLMITGNFALLAGLDPDEVDEWYMIVYADAYQWVEMPNTRGMALFADGGVVGSKPYAASGAYINRMSDYCRGCAYDVKDAVGENACPFNYLYWDFMARHRDTLGGNNRLAMPMRTLEKMAPARVQAMREKAARFLESIEETTGWMCHPPQTPRRYFRARTCRRCTPITTAPCGAATAFWTSNRRSRNQHWKFCWAWYDRPAIPVRSHGRAAAPRHASYAAVLLTVAGPTSRFGNNHKAQEETMSMFDMANMKKLKSLGAKAPDTWKAYRAFG